MHQRTPFAAAIDTAIVVTFVAVGRRNHESGEALSGVAGTAAPFLIALAAAWILLKVNGDRVYEDPTKVITGVVLWAFTITAGMLMRRFVFDDGTAFSFIVVASIFLGLLVGWRVAASAISNRRTTAL